MYAWRDEVILKECQRGHNLKKIKRQIKKHFGDIARQV